MKKPPTFKTKSNGFLIFFQVYQVSTMSGKDGIKVIKCSLSLPLGSSNYSKKDRYVTNHVTVWSALSFL